MSANSKNNQHINVLNLLNVTIVGSLLISIRKYFCFASPRVSKSLFGHNLSLCSINISFSFEFGSFFAVNIHETHTVFEYNHFEICICITCKTGVVVACQCALCGHGSLLIFSKYIRHCYIFFIFSLFAEQNIQQKP